MSRRLSYSLVAAAALVCACAGSPGATTTPDAATPTAIATLTPTPTAAPTPTPIPSPKDVVGAGESWLVYQWVDGNGEGIFLARPDGTGGHQLVSDLAGSEIHPDWSPDGQRIAFVRFTPEDRSELWVVNADGTGAQSLVQCPLPCNSFGYPDWSTDGQSIIFGRDANATPTAPPSTFQVARHDLQTGETTIILERKDGMPAEQPRLSPDGGRLAYTRAPAMSDGNEGSAIFVADVGSRKERQLTEWSLFGAHPDWSADDLIVFNTRDLGLYQDTTEPANLFTVRPDGSDVTQLTTFGNADIRATQPRWAPDGSGITYTHVTPGGYGERTAAFFATGGAASPFTGDPIIATHATLRPLP